MNAREIILQKIRVSTDEKILPMFRGRMVMRYVSFGEVMDILLYYLSLQPDLSSMAEGVKMKDFWFGVMKEAWINFPAKAFSFIKRNPWANESGPMDGYMGAAEYYLHIHPGFYNMTMCECLLWPEALAGEKEKNWPKHKKLVESQTFPKFRRKWHTKKLAAALDFAEEVCQSLRKRKNAPVAKRKK